MKKSRQVPPQPAKWADKMVVVIEVNDNPSVESGIEDQVLGDALYDRIMEEFLLRIEAGKQAAPGRSAG